MNKRLMIIIRGMPGSGKTTKAIHMEKGFKTMFEASVVLCSADEYFTDSAGNYNFNAAKIGEAHKACQDKALKAIQDGIDIIIIHNTSTRRWEHRDYITMAEENNISVHEIIMDFEDIIHAQQNPVYKKVLASSYCARNKHGVRYETILKMIERFEV